MKRLLVSFLAISFILWVLPLGVFIKPSQQKIACDGQRAFCMCTIGHKSPDKAMEAGILLKASSSNNNKNSSGGGSNYFVSAKPIVASDLQLTSLFENQYLCYKNPYLAVLEYVPKI